MKKNILFYLEPYTYITKKNKTFILYNTLSGKYLELIANNDYREEVLNEMINPKNNYVISINDNIATDPLFKDFIVELRKNYFGDCFETTSSIKPNLFTPKINIQQKQYHERVGVGAEIKGLLREITFVLNNNTTSIYHHPFTMINNHSSKENTVYMDQTNLLNTLELLNFNLICGIHFTGVNIWNYSNFDNIIGDIKGNNKRITISSFGNDIIKFKSLIRSVLEIILKWKVYLKNHYSQDLTLILDNFGQYLSKIKWVFVLSSRSDFYKATEIIERNALKNYSFHLMVKNNNLINDMLITKEMLLHNVQDMKSILLKQNLNPLKFGKLIVQYNGDTYANTYRDNLGNIFNDDLDNLIENELINKTGWFTIRKNVKPCLNCIYNFLCPPITDYEFILNKHNLCNIKL